MARKAKKCTCQCPDCLSGHHCRQGINLWTTTSGEMINLGTCGYKPLENETRRRRYHRLYKPNEEEIDELPPLWVSDPYHLYTEQAQAYVSPQEHKQAQAYVSPQEPEQAQAYVSPQEHEQAQAYVSPQEPEQNSSDIVYYDLTDAIFKSTSIVNGLFSAYVIPIGIGLTLGIINILMQSIRAFFRRNYEQ